MGFPLKEQYQVVVVGGGINGAGVAREAAARGFSTLLIEKEDFAHATSSQSSKMIHGGIRYLEQGHFGLVRESLKERRILLKTAPHLVHPLRINIPIYRGDRRPPWMIHLGCRLYDIFAGAQNLKSSRKLSREEREALTALNQQGLRSVLRYSDGQVLDSRLPLEVALSAQSYGADIRNYLELVAVRRRDDHYQLTLFDKRSASQVAVRAQFLVNAAGPWAPQVDQGVSTKPNRPRLRFVRGIHFVIPNIGQSTGFLILPSDGRVVFVLPWLEKYTLVGTTEDLFEGQEFDKIPSSPREERYLLDLFNHYFPKQRLTRDQVQYIYAGVRSLIDRGEPDLSKMSREYHIEREMLSKSAGYVALFGGKITTYRSLACKVLSHIPTALTPLRPQRWDTETAPLFGGFPVPAETQERLQAALLKAGIAAPVWKRWREIFGSRWTTIAELALGDEALRKSIVYDWFLEAELRYMVDTELAYRLEDVIARRCKMIYELNDIQKGLLQEVLDRVL